MSTRPVPGHPTCAPGLRHESLPSSIPHLCPLYVLPASLWLRRSSLSRYPLWGRHLPQPAANRHITSAPAHVYSRCLAETACAPTHHHPLSSGVATRDAVQLRSVHIRFSPDRPVGVLFAGKAAGADARAHVVGRGFAFL